MSHYDYDASKRVVKLDVPFHAVLMAAMRQADSDNAAKLQEAFPETWLELGRRYNAPGGVLPEEIEQERLEREEEQRREEQMTRTRGDR